MSGQHRFEVTTAWTGNLGSGTSGYRAYSRNHEITAPGKPAPVPGSSAPAFRGDRARFNPEELLVSALSACQMLSLLHLCADAGIVITEYRDQATGTMRQNDDGSGEFTEVTLHPRITITDPSRAKDAEELSHKAHELCFIARSVNFPVRVEPAVSAAPATIKA
jgi:organic hydroperoxide reductase OsmC/OhrA